MKEHNWNIFNRNSYIIILACFMIITGFFGAHIWKQQQKGLQFEQTVTEETPVFSYDSFEGHEIMSIFMSISSISFSDAGAIRWDDNDGDGKPNFRWEGTDIEKSAKLFIEHLTNCKCVCGK